MSKITELREKNPADLQKELIALRKEQFNLRMQHATRQLTQTHNLRRVRQTIARIKSVLHEIGQAS